MPSRDDSNVLANFLQKDLVDSALVFQELLSGYYEQDFHGLQKRPLHSGRLQSLENRRTADGEINPISSTTFCSPLLCKQMNCR